MEETESPRRGGRQETQLQHGADALRRKPEECRVRLLQVWGRREAVGLVCGQLIQTQPRAELRRFFRATWKMAGHPGQQHVE